MFFNNEIVRIANASSARKAETERRLRYYFDEQSQATLALIGRRWSRPEHFRVFPINAVRAITNRRANTYRVQPRRTFSGVDQAVSDQIYRELNADAVLKKASRYVKLLKTSMLQVGWDEAAGVPTLNVITPNVIDVIYSDPERPERIIITHRTPRAEDVTYSDWTPAGFRHLNYRGAPKRIDGNPAGVNPYGVLPFVPLFDRLFVDRYIHATPDTAMPTESHIAQGGASFRTTTNIPTSTQSVSIDAADEMERLTAALPISRINTITNSRMTIILFPVMRAQ